MDEKLFDAITTRPAMYCIATLNELFCFMLGYGIASGMSFKEVQTWATTTFNRPPNWHWTSVLLTEFGNDRAGIEKFRAVFRDFYFGV